MSLVAVYYQVHAKNLSSIFLPPLNLSMLLMLSNYFAICIIKALIDILLLEYLFKFKVQTNFSLFSWLETGEITAAIH